MKSCFKKCYDINKAEFFNIKLTTLQNNDYTCK